MSPLTPIAATTDPDAASQRAGLMATAAGLLAAAIVISLLYWGRGVLVPLALTALISFALGPAVTWLRRFIGLRLAVASTVLVAVLLVAGLAFLLAWQLADLAGNLPKYRINLYDKIEALRGGGGVIADAVNAVRDLGYQLTRPQPESGAMPPASPPIPVRIEEPTALELLSGFLLPVILPLLTAGLIVVLVVFMLLEREPLRDRLIQLISRGDISRTTAAINDAAERLSRFLATQLLINVGFGAVLAGVLWLIGMPNPLVWGLLGGVLRFIPYAGSAITAVVPTLVAIAVSPGWTMPLLTLGAILACEIVTGQLVEPLRYGSSTGLSPLAVLVSTLVWAVLWGPIGLLLAMPLTVCLIVIGRHVPQLAFLGVLLGDGPALPQEAKIYHRLLAHSPFDAIEIAVEHAQEQGVRSLHEDVLLRVLMMAETDRRRGALDVERQSLIADGIDEIIAAVAVEPETAAASGQDADGEAAADRDADGKAPAAPDDARTLCIGARSLLDLAAAALAADLLRRRGVPARASTLGDLPQSMAVRPIEAVALCIVSPGSATMITHLLRRMRHHIGTSAAVVVGGFAAVAMPLPSQAAAGAPAATPPIARTLAGLCDVLLDALKAGPANGDVADSAGKSSGPGN